MAVFLGFGLLLLLFFLLGLTLAHADFLGVLAHFLVHLRLVVRAIRFKIMHDTAAAKLCSLCGSAESGAIGPFAAEYGGFVVVPVAFAPAKAAIFGPEEEPDGGDDETGAEDAEEDEDDVVVDVGGVDGAAAGDVGRVLVCVAGEEEGVHFERGDGVCGAFGDEEIEIVEGGHDDGKRSVFARENSRTEAQSTTVVRLCEFVKIALADCEIFMRIL